MHLLLVGISHRTAPIELREDRDGRKREPLGWKVFVEQPVSEVYAGLQATVYRTIALMVAGVLFSILAAMWLAGSMVRPIRTLQDGAQKIGEGDLETQIDVRTGDELQGLAEQFNRMTAQLRESYAGLERKVEEDLAWFDKYLFGESPADEAVKDGSPLAAALERSRTQIETLAVATAELESSIPTQVGNAVRDGLRAEVLPVARHIAEIRGRFEGELTCRKQLVIHPTGKVSGKIRYGRIVIEEGGEVAGDVGALGAAKPAVLTTTVKPLEAANAAR